MAENIPIEKATPRETKLEDVLAESLMSTTSCIDPNNRLLQLAEITSKTNFAQTYSTNNSTSSEGANPCRASVETSSMKELRLKGSAFIRSHASKHGISNASRKLMSEVLVKLRDHYAHVHRVLMLDDDFKDVSYHGKTNKKKSHTFKHEISPPVVNSSTTTNATSAASAAAVAILPQVPLPVPLTPIHFKQTMTNPPQIVMQTSVPNIIQNVQIIDSKPLASPFDNQPPQQQSAISSTNSAFDAPIDVQNDKHNFPNVMNVCTAKILALRRGDLLAFGTSILRPEAALHKVHNSSRKPKQLVIDELWKHYVEFHSKELLDSSNTAPGWVGSVKDDEEDK